MVHWVPVTHGALLLISCGIGPRSEALSRGAELAETRKRASVKYRIIAIISMLFWIE
jgi:hypothetical protein